MKTAKQIREEKGSFLRVHRANQPRTKLQAMRHKAGVMGADVAEQVGITEAHYSKLELGLCLPNTKIALKLAKFFACQVEDLFTLEEK